VQREPSYRPGSRLDESMRPSHRRFRFTHRVLEGRALRLGYRLEGGPSADVDLEEGFMLPDRGPAPRLTPAAERVVEALHLAAGVSYWKTSCPEEIVVDAGPLADDDAAFFESLYTNGLGEFFQTNGIAPRPLPRFPRGGPERAPASPEGDAAAGPLVLLGGGKDSAVSVEILRTDDSIAPIALSVNAPTWIRRSAAASELEHLVVERKLPQELFALNEQGAWNGHVPVTALVLMAAHLVAVLGGHCAVVASNERSASVGNVEWDGVVVNHQWSKGLDFERAWQAWGARHLSGGPASFSLLRPLSELHVARCFASHPRWFDAVTSCNANFALRPGAPPERWCGICPKCVFVFLVMTPWLTDEHRATLFGRDLLDDARTLPIVEELLGLARHKPFECVGTPDEVTAALWLCHERGLHDATPALALFRERVLPTLSDPQRFVEEALCPSGEHLVPRRHAQMLHAYLRSR